MDKELKKIYLLENIKDKEKLKQITNSKKLYFKFNGIYKELKKFGINKKLPVSKLKKYIDNAISYFESTSEFEKCSELLKFKNDL